MIFQEPFSYKENLLKEEDRHMGLSLLSAGFLFSKKEMVGDTGLEPVTPTM
jgi:hypothetical protein